jgi:FAD/FMN-containing dehydrogenase
MTLSKPSWGLHPHLPPTEVVHLRDRSSPLPYLHFPMLPYGNGRSYGDSCQNGSGGLLLTRGLDRFIDFDPVTGVLRCESGMLLDDILDVMVPRGWLLPVLPGTSQITVGGAIANDVHGKNHHRAGSFGDHLRRFELLRSDGSRLECGPESNADLFAATIGGLGLTGLVTWAELQLQPIPGPWLSVENLRFGNLDEFFPLSAESNRDFEYTVAWIDCAASRTRRGRGIFSRARFVEGIDRPPTRARPALLRVPFTPPFPVIGGAGLRLFNRCYYAWPRQRQAIRHFRRFFFPLDGIGGWNRLYGPNGFVQHQCVLPPENAADALEEMLDVIAAASVGSFLAVLKTFGERASRGMIGFPRPGTTLAMDFPFRGEKTLRLLDRLNELVVQAGGALYPAKDAHMTGEQFRRAFPNWRSFMDHLDPGFSSSFWRRVWEIEEGAHD